MSVAKNIRAVILHTRVFKETSLIVHTLSKEMGRLDLIALGARRIKSPLRGSLERFSITDVIISYKENRSLQQIREAKSIFIFDALIRNPDKSLLVSEIMKFIIKTIPSGTQDTEMFTILVNFLKVFQNSDKSLEGILTISFLLKSLKHLGFAPEFKRCLKCKRKLKEGFYIPKTGGVLCGKCYSGKNGIEVDSRTIVELRYLFKPFRLLLRTNFSSIMLVWKILKNHYDFHVYEGLVERLESSV